MSEIPAVVAVAVADVKTEVVEVAAEVKAEVAAVVAEVKAEVASVVAEVKAEATNEVAEVAAVVVQVAQTAEAALSGVLDALQKEIGASGLQETAALLKYIPRLATTVHALAIPGAEKKQAVIKALHDLVKALHTAGTIAADKQSELDGFIDSVVPITVDTILDVAKGRVTFETLAKPETVAAVATCCVGLFGMLASKSKSKNAEVAAPAAAAPESS